MDENERRGVEGYILKLELATEVGRRGDPARHASRLTVLAIN